MPDLRKILRKRLGLVSDLYLRDRPGDTGALPVRDRISASPDIAIVDKGASSPSIDGGFAGLGKFISGQDYSVYVRMRNRGHDKVEGQVRIYWSEVATLITPSMWNPLAPHGGDALAALSSAVPADGRPVWSRPIDWRPPVSATGGAAVPAHYCFMAVLEEPLKADPSRPDPVSPPGSALYFDWNEHRSFLRRHNNVACRNFHLIDIRQDLNEESVYELAFAMTGTPDLARRFDFAIIRCLPGTARVSLDVPLALASRLARRRLWKSDPIGLKQARLQLPSVPRLRIERLRLLAEARFECHFRISGENVEPGHSLAIRQLYRGEEVGRITWRFRSGSS